MTDPTMRPAFEQWLKQVAPHGHERDHWHVWQAAWAARACNPDLPHAALADELERWQAEDYLDEAAPELFDRIKAALRAPPPGRLDCGAALAHLNELFEQAPWMENPVNANMSVGGCHPVTYGDLAALRALPRVVEGGAATRLHQTLLRALSHPNTGDGGSSDTRSKCASPESE